MSKDFSETVTYETTKYLNILLTPLAKSEHTILNADDFIEKIQRAIIPEGCKIISLDVKNVFINVPPDQTSYISYIMMIPTPTLITKNLILF